MCFHVSLLKRYKNGNRGSAPPYTVSNDDGAECEIDMILARCDTRTRCRSYYVQWKGLPPEQNEWLTASKLKDATDGVKASLDELNNTGSYRSWQA